MVSQMWDSVNQRFLSRMSENQKTAHKGKNERRVRMPEILQFVVIVLGILIMVCLMRLGGYPNDKED